MPRYKQYELRPLQSVAIQCLRNIRKKNSGLNSIKVDTIIRRLKSQYGWLYLNFV